MSDWANGEGYTTLEEVFASRDFGRPPPHAAAVVAAKPAPRVVRARLFTNRAIATISAGAAALSVVATLVVNGGGPSLAPVISAQHAPSNVPDFLTPVPQNAGGQGAAGGSSSGGAATGSSAGAPAAAGTTPATGGGSPAGGGGPSVGSGGTTVVALGPSPASASLASFTVSHPTPAPKGPPAPDTTTANPSAQPTLISSGPAVTGGHDNGGGNGGQNNGNGNAKTNGASNHGGGTAVVTVVSSTDRGHGRA